MTTVEIIIKAMPYLFWLTGITFIILLSLHLKNLRYHKFQDEIKLGEDKINENFSHLDDTAILNELNELESSAGNPVRKE